MLDKNKPMKYNSPNVSPLLEAGNIILLLLIALLSVVGSGYAQNPSLKVFEDWNDTAGTQNMFRKNVVRPELGTTNVYVAGATLNSAGNYDLLVTKYNTSGAVLWTQQYDGNGNGDDYAFDLQLDNSGNVYVTGTTYENTTDSLNTITIMYDANGNQQWLSTYNGNGSGNDVGAALYVDNSTGEIFVAGSEWEGSSALYDFLVLKYDNSGNQQWAANFDNANLNDGAIRVTVNPGTGNVEAGGATQTTSTNRKYLVLEVDNSSGSYINHYTSSSNTFGIDNLTDLKVDAMGNVYVTGAVLNTTTGFDIRTIKLDTALNVVWSSTYAGSLDDMGNALVVDANNNVIVTGYTNTATQGRNYVTIKYNSAGTQQWAATFNGSANANDSATAIAVRDTNKIYVTGYSYNGSSKDYYTIRYDAAGNEIWGIGFNSINNGDDRAFEIANDTTGQIYVTGQTKVNDSTYVYNTVKYLEKEVLNPLDTASSYNSFLFVENRGQLINTYGDSVPEIRFYNAYTSNPMVYFMDTCLSYVLARGDTAITAPDSVSRVDLKHVGQNGGKICAYNVSEPYMNFFFPHIPEGRGRCQEYENLVFKELYNGVDVVYGSNMMGLKTFYITKPHGGGGSPVNQINLKFEGADSVRVLAGGELAVYTKLAVLIYPRPAVWQIDLSGTRTNLAWQPTYTIIAPGEVKFASLGSYSSSEYLIISMDWGARVTSPMTIYNNVWSTFIQGEGTCELGQGATVDNAGYSYFTGTTTSYFFPAFIGFQMVLSGGQNSFALKFQPNNHREWATYIGGSYVDVGTDIKVDAAGSVFVYGFSLSDDYPPNANGSQHTQTNLLFDPTAIITKLNVSGTSLLWSTYFGGDDDDWFDLGGHRMQLDLAGNVYICGVTNSDATEGFPILAHLTSSTAYNQPDFGGGSTDAYLAMFDNNGVLQWSTYLGGNGEDEATSICIYQNSLTYVGGYTSSKTSELICDAPTTIGKFPICNNGGFSQSIHGNSNSGTYDAFLMKFDSAFELAWSTYYGGDGEEAELAEVLPLLNGNIAFVGSTTTTTGTVGCGTPNAGEIALCDPGSATYNTANAGGKDLFMTEFVAATDVLYWGTFYGGTGDEAPWQAVFADDGFIIAGNTIHGGFPSVDPGNNFYKQANNADASGNSGDGILIGISSEVVYWSTHYGGYYSAVPNCSNDEEWISGIAYDPLSNSIFVTGVARSMSGAQVSFPYRCGAPQYCWETTPQTTQNNSGVLQDIFVAQFDLNGGVGIEDTSQVVTTDVQIFPNPSDGQFTIALPAATDFTHYSVINNLGQVIVQEKITTSSGRILNLDLSTLAEGVYVILFESSEGPISKRIILSK